MIANELVHIFFHRRAYCVICTWNSFMTLFADDAVYVICKMHIADEKTHLTVSINVILHCGHKGNYHVICRIFRHFFLSQHSLNSWHLSEQFSVPLQLFFGQFLYYSCTFESFSTLWTEQGKIERLYFTAIPLSTWKLSLVLNRFSDLSSISQAKNINNGILNFVEPHFWRPWDTSFLPWLDKKTQESN